MVVKNGGVQLQSLSELGESSSSGSIDTPWSGRLHQNTSLVNIGGASYKGKKKVVEPLGLLEISTRHLYVDGDSSGLEHSLDDVFEI